MTTDTPLTPILVALSIPLAAVAVLLLGCVKVTDTYKSVGWQADSLRLTGVDGCTDSIDRKRGSGHHTRADCLPNRARRPRGSKAFHGGIGHLHFNVVLHARRPRDYHAGDGARPIPFQALPFHRQWNGRHRLAAHHVRDPASLEVLIRAQMWNLPH